MNTTQNARQPAVGVPKIAIGQFSSPGQKASNDDSFGVAIPEPALLRTKGIAMAIADGVSTSDAGKAASETCIKAFLTDYYATHESWTVKSSVARVMTATNRWLYGQGQTQYLSDRGMVSTFTGAILKAGLVHVFHVGDSRLYLIRGDSIECKTTDHITRISRDRQYLSRAIGHDVSVDMDHTSFAAQAGDLLLFTTDGVHAYLSDARLLALACGGDGNLDHAAKAIVQAALEAGSPDNVTAQLVRIVDAGKADRDAFFQQLTELPFPPVLWPGQVMDGYRIESELHASKRTQIYLATDKDSGERVVLKTPSVNFADDPAFIEMFQREEWIGRSIDSPHVLKVFAPERPRSFLYYVTEYLEGQSLRAWMDANPRPDLDRVRSIVAQIIKGLRAFHRREMLHQDLKPDNIFITHDDRVKIIDFGSTRVAGLEEVALPVERPGMLGTRGYMAPEYQLGERPSTRSDLFSLGAIVYEMLTGKLPYGEGFASPGDVERLSYTPATEYNKDLPAWLAGALARALEKNPRKRYAALSEFERDLSEPNPELVRVCGSFLERNPAGFWRGVAVVSLLGNLLLLFLLLARG